MKTKKYLTTASEDSSRGTGEIRSSHVYDTSPVSLYFPDIRSMLNRTGGTKQR